jgi:NADPH:quinone reductase-like Zn-dependent oxidoreductase
MRAVGVNVADHLARVGLYPSAPKVPFANAPQADRILAARENVGKVVLVP